MYTSALSGAPEYSRDVDLVKGIRPVGVVSFVRCSIRPVVENGQGFHLPSHPTQIEIPRGLSIVQVQAVCSSQMLVVYLRWGVLLLLARGVSRSWNWLDSGKITIVKAKYSCYNENKAL